MHTPDAETEIRRPADANGRGLGAAVKDVTEHAKTLVSLEVELASLELKRKAAELGVGTGLLVGAAVFGLFTMGFLFATVAAALATFLPTWAALLIVTGFLLLVAIVLGLIGIRRVKKGTPPVPEQAIEEAKRTQEALKSNGN
jgi:uncharacterized membrane protein YqjE